jgi:hypothetical protein
MSKHLTAERLQRIKDHALKSADPSRGDPREVVVAVDQEGRVRVRLTYLTVKPATQQ